MYACTRVTFTYLRIFVRERKGRFLGKIVYTQCNETLPVYGREEKRGNVGVTRGERKVSKEDRERGVSEGGGEEEEGGRGEGVL